ncbi:MAG TPA: hypothetical protein VK890_10725, partial [Bacteroidia bacterium]|nr:hypothetical protein [Bacteroidia bacterium]
MEREFVSSGEKASTDFNFSSPEILKLLQHKPIEFVGTATSDFQSEPFTYDENGEPLVTSDWEYELLKNLEGKESGIQVQQIKEDLPHFFTHKRLYTKRSQEI